MAVTTLGGSRKLLDVQVTELSTWSLDHTSSVRLGVVGGSLSESNSLGHLRGAGIREGQFRLV